MIKNKLVSTRLLLSIVLIMSIQNALAVQLSLDNSRPLNLSEDISYDISDELIEIKFSDAIVCRNLAGSNNDLNAEITDPNGDGIEMPLLENVNYDLAAQTLKTRVDNNDGVCVSKHGSVYGDLISRYTYDVENFSITGLNNQLVRGQTIDYKIRIENLENVELEFDLIEFVSRNSTASPAYFESVDEWNCNNHNNSGVDCNEDNTDNKLFNAAIPGGGYAEIDVSRTVAANSSLGQTVDILTVMFVRDGNDIVDVFYQYNSPTVVDNDAPVLSWVNGSTLNFIEDDSQSQMLSFEVNDSTGVDLSVGYLSTAIGAVNDKLIIDGIDVVEDQPGEFTVSFDVTPKPDQFTAAGNTEQIFVQIEDIFNASSNLLMLDIEIDPINDAPSFVPTCFDFTINPTPIGGETEITCNISNGANRATWNYTDFIGNISAGGVGNDTEAGQNVIFEVLPVSGLATTGTIMVTQDPGTFILNDLMLILSDGVSGSGSFRIRALDNGTPGGQTDVCPAVNPTDHCNTSEYSQIIDFNILAPVYYVSGTVDDLPLGDELGIRFYENGTTNALGGTQVIDGIGANGGQIIKFTYPEEFINGTDYEVQIIFQPQNRSCSITGGATGIINGMNMDNLFISCGPN